MIQGAPPTPPQPPPTHLQRCGKPCGQRLDVTLHLRDAVRCARELDTPLNHLGWDGRQQRVGGGVGAGTENWGEIIECEGKGS